MVLTENLGRRQRSTLGLVCSLVVSTTNWGENCLACLLINDNFADCDQVPVVDNFGRTLIVAGMLSERTLFHCADLPGRYARLERSLRGETILVVDARGAA